TSAPHTVGAGQTISFGIALMNEHGFRHLPVLQGGKLVGIVSDRDLGLIAGLNEVNPDETPIEEAMTQVLYTASPDTLLSEVLDRMYEHKAGSVLVTEGQKVVGIFTTHDAVRLLAEGVR
ncbi:MAG: CBS domain-containing protein, partial [Myxococcales bacterium]|nr:CBS domain-containing protein [Myxococcales bacterium]